jgi:hypothetical protein
MSCSSDLVLHACLAVLSRPSYCTHSDLKSEVSSIWPVIARKSFGAHNLTHTISGDLPMARARPREEDELQDERAPKRFKPSEDEPHQADAVMSSATTGESPQGQFHLYNLENLLPPSRELLGLPPTSQIPPDGVMHRTSEPDVGISEYIGKGLPSDTRYYQAAV